MPQTLYDKIWNNHLVGTRSDGLSVLYIDRHLLHEVTSPQAFEGLKNNRRSIWRLDANLATPDHAIPTVGRSLGLDGIDDPIAKEQVITLQENCADFKVNLIDLLDERQGIVHVIGPEQGATLPGTTIVCGDSHTSTHGAFGALAHGIGTSEVEHVLATQCLVQEKSGNMRIHCFGSLSHGLAPKDVILAIIAQIGTAGATGYTVEYTGQAIEEMSMEGRMTVCNMSIEAGARAGLVSPDIVTYAYLEDRPMAPKGDMWDQALSSWEKLRTDEDAHFDKEVDIDVEALSPQVSWGTNPELVSAVDSAIPNPDSFETEAQRETGWRALQYMDLEPDRPIETIPIDRVFIGSCTNARIEDMRAAARVVQGRRVSSALKGAYVVPGSGLVKLHAESEGLDTIFKEAGFEWRDPGCSMCLAMNNDRLYPGERCASTSNRNFEGRQGHLGRTHLMSPQSAAASAITGYITDVRGIL